LEHGCELVVARSLLAADRAHLGIEREFHVEEIVIVALLMSNAMVRLVRVEPCERHARVHVDAHADAMAGALAPLTDVLVAEPARVHAVPARLVVDELARVRGPVRPGLHAQSVPHTASQLPRVDAPEHRREHAKPVRDAV
jgi:hypothetical protein